jgi:hypothetical protein
MSEAEAKMPRGKSVTSLGGALLVIALLAAYLDNSSFRDCT